MTEYIKREEAIKKMQELKRYAWAHPNRAEYRSTLDVDDVLFGLHYLPAADVVEVRHGRWEYDFALDGSNFYKCSLCGRQEVLLEKEGIAEWCPYCHCGARMDGE